MPSPIAHLGVGYALYCHYKARLPQDKHRFWKLPFQLILVAGLSVLPDSDVIPAIIFRDMQKYLSEKQKEQSTQLYVIWEFCYKTLPLHLWSNVWGKDINEFKNKDNFAQ